MDEAVSGKNYLPLIPMSSPIFSVAAAALQEAGYHATSAADDG